MSKIPSLGGQVISAGILLQSNGKYLIAHPTAKTGTTKGWGIPKGKQDEGESYRETAFREFYEETNLNLHEHPEVVVDDEPFLVYQVKMKKNKYKDVYVFKAVDTKNTLTNFPFECISFVKPGVPELDDYKWVTKEQALEIVTKSQKSIFQNL